jgi:hypothetical protein
MYDASNGPKYFFTKMRSTTLRSTLSHLSLMSLRSSFDFLRRVGQLALQSPPFPLHSELLLNDAHSHTIAITWSVWLK